MVHRSRVHPMWPSNLCNYNQKEMDVIVDNCRLIYAKRCCCRLLLRCSRWISRRRSSEEFLWKILPCQDSHPLGESSEACYACFCVSFAGEIVHDRVKVRKSGVHEWNMLRNVAWKHKMLRDVNCMTLVRKKDEAPARLQAAKTTHGSRAAHAAGAKRL